MTNTSIPAATKKYKISGNGILIILIMFLMTMRDYIFNSLVYDTPLYYFAGWKDLLVIFFLGMLLLKY